MLLNEQDRLNPRISHPFINAKEGFNYLGINITPKIANLSAANYDPMINELSDDF